MMLKCGPCLKEGFDNHFLLSSSSSSCVYFQSIIASGKNHLTEICFKSFDAQDWDRICRRCTVQHIPVHAAVNLVRWWVGDTLYMFDGVVKTPSIASSSSSAQWPVKRSQLAQYHLCCIQLCSLHSASEHFSTNSAFLWILHMSVLDLALHWNALNRSLFSIGIEMELKCSCHRALAGALHPNTELQISILLHRSNLSNQILPEEKRIKLQQIWIKLRHNYFWVEKAKNSILRQNPIKVGRITQKKTFLTNKMSMYKTVKTNDKICFMKNKDVCLMCPESVSGNNSPWAISSNTLPRDQEIYCILDNMVSCPYTAERRDVLGNTSVEDQEISRGWGFCTLGTCNS